MPLLTASCKTTSCQTTLVPVPSGKRSFTASTEDSPKNFRVQVMLGTNSCSQSFLPAPWKRLLIPPISHTNDSCSGKSHCNQNQVGKTVVHDLPLLRGTTSNPD